MTTKITKTLPRISTITPSENSIEFRLLHAVCCNPRQKIKILNDRLEYADCSPNLLVQYFSALEGLARFIVIKHQLFEDSKKYAITREHLEGVYRKFKFKGIPIMLGEIARLFPNYFEDSDTDELIKKVEGFTEVRNLLVHECGFIRGSESHKHIEEVSSMLVVLKNIISNEDTMKNDYFYVDDDKT